MQCRIEHVEVGDIINRDPDGLGGWFTVAEISTLFNGDTQFADETGNETITGGEKDIVGVQLLEEVELDPETGYVLETRAAPVQVIAATDPAPPVPVPVSVEVMVEPEPAPPVEQVVEPEPAPPVEPAPAPPVVEPEPAAPMEPVAEPAPAAPVEATPSAAVAEVATGAEPADPGPVPLSSVAPDFSAAAAVDLSKVADALSSLDVGSDAPTVSYVPEPDADETDDDQAIDRSRRSTDPSSVKWVRPSPDLPPDLPPVAMPEGAVPVYGDTLPDSPSYLNPVVVREPEAAPLPKRRAAR